jgi:hypothetical protein
MIDPDEVISVELHWSGEHLEPVSYVKDMTRRQLGELLNQLDGMEEPSE